MRLRLLWQRSVGAPVTTVPVVEHLVPLWMAADELSTPPPPVVHLESAQQPLQRSPLVVSSQSSTNISVQVASSPGISTNDVPAGPSTSPAPAGPLLRGTFGSLQNAPPSPVAMAQPAAGPLRSASPAPDRGWRLGPLLEAAALATAPASDSFGSQQPWSIAFEGPSTECRASTPYSCDSTHRWPCCPAPPQRRHAVKARGKGGQHIREGGHCRPVGKRYCCLSH